MISKVGKNYNPVFCKRKKSFCSYCGKFGHASVKSRQRRRSPISNGKIHKEFVPRNFIMLIANMLYRKRLETKLPPE